MTGMVYLNIFERIDLAVNMATFINFDTNGKLWKSLIIIISILFPTYYSQVLSYFLFRFKDGLKTMALLDSIQKYPHLYEDSFCECPVTLTANTLEDIFTVTMSEMGSNHHDAELSVVGFWRDFLQDIEGVMFYYFI